MKLAPLVLAHYRRHARDLPWRRTRDPYAIWVSEIMAQQTRIETVLPYWKRWMARFPDVRALAGAPLGDVLHAWAGLGYYARARALHAAARQIVERHGGDFPREPGEIRALPGIGRYTAGAIASIAFDRPVPAVDGNVARVLARVFAIDDDVSAPAARARLWALAAAEVPERAPGEYNQGLMELGATICTPRAPRCLICPLAAVCAARRQGRAGELPVLRPRGPTPVVEVTAAWAKRGGGWLVCRREPRGLFGGLWELPDVAALAAGGNRLILGETIAEHIHQLTHRTIIYRVVRTRLGRGGLRLAPPYEEARFVTAWDGLAVSSATAALAARLASKEESWPTPNAPTASSAKATTRSSRASRT